MIRKANNNDIEQINILGDTLHDDFAKLFHLETEIDSKYGIVLVSEENGKINGFVYAMDLIDNVDLLSIVVDKEYRGQNIGSKLMEYLIDNYCFQKTITLEVAVDNEAAIGLYKKFDFVVENIRKCYYNGVDAYLMRRK